MDKKKLDTFCEELQKFCKTVPEGVRAEVLLFIRIWKRFPEFREELHTLAEPGEKIPPLEVTEALMEKYAGRLQA